MKTLWIILVLLVATRLCGALAARFQQPVLVGELIAGVGLGFLFRFFHNDFPLLDFSNDHHFMALVDLGIFFLMLLGGVEIRPRELVELRVKTMLVAGCAMLLPLLSGFTLAWHWLPIGELRFAQALFVGTALAITAVPVTIKVLMDLQLLQSDIGKLIVSAAVFDDLLSLILLSILTAILHTGSLPVIDEILLIIARVVLFLVLIVILGHWVMPLVARFISRFAIDEIEFSFLLVMGTLFALLAEVLELHFILGAFAAGLFFGRQTFSDAVYDDLRKKITAITMGFLAPIFFASIGLELNLSAVTQVPVFLLALIIIAFMGKLLGAAIPAMMLGVPQRDAWAVGVAMSARGAVELIIAGIAFRAGLFDQGDGNDPVVANLYSAVVIVAIVTTIAAPMGMRWILSRGRQPRRL